MNLLNCVLPTMIFRLPENAVQEDDASMVTTSPELIKEVLVKQFSTFVNRRPVNLNVPSLFLKSVFLMRDQRWKQS